jgi:co-chaperonin GroES (HSP10)
MIEPTAGQAFIVEDTKEDTTASGIVLNHKNKSKGAIGTIYAINPSVLCPHCQELAQAQLKVGDHVIYSRFVAEHVELKEVQTNGRLFCVPVDAILAKLS